MDYGSIIERSFRLAWKYKSLWILGLFSSYGSMNFGYNDARLKTVAPDAAADPTAFLSQMAPFFMVIFWLALLMLVAYCITKPALIDAVNRLTRGGVYTLADSFSAGVNLFFRFLGITILSMVLLLAAVFALILIFSIAFVINVGLGIVLLIPGIPLFFVLIWVYLSVFQLAERALVVRDTNIADALGEGWMLFRSHLKESAIIVLILIGLAIGLGIAATIVMLILGAPITVAVMALNLPLLPALIAGFIMALPVAIVIGGFMGTAMTTLYTLFYFELVEPGGVHSDVASKITPTV